MTTSYPDELGEWVKRRKSSKRANGLVAFLAVRDDVRAAIEAGYPVKTIWAQMRESQCVSVCYDTFLKYVNRHILNPGDSLPAALTTRPASAPAKKSNNAVDLNTDAERAVSTRASPVAGFTFNSAPKKEDLI